jgi:hypothetical protein
VDEEWPIDELFDEDYLHFFAGRLTDDRADEEASTIWSLLALRDGTEVLDLACGHGRIANRLAGWVPGSPGWTKPRSSWMWRVPTPTAAAWTWTTSRGHARHSLERPL